MKYYLDDKEVEILETQFEDGTCQIISAAFVNEPEIYLTKDECLVLEEQYQSELAQDHYSELVDHAHDFMSDRA